MKKSNKQLALDALADGPLTRNEISLATGLHTQQTNNALHGVKVEGLAVKNKDDMWQLTTPQNVPVTSVVAGKLMIGDLLEVAGTSHDGTYVVRTLEEQKMYTLIEL